MVETTDKPTSRNIPLPIQRAVRQRCGFGCVLCGLPLYEYDHLLGWAKVERHVADEIALLCDLHHRERTSGLISDDAVRAANAQPFNLRNGVSRPYDLHYQGETCSVVIGSNRFEATSLPEGAAVIPISVDGDPILAFIMQDCHLLLNLALFDEFNNLVLHIRNNQLVQSVTPWDIHFVGRRLVIREAARRVLVDMTFEVPNTIRIDRGRFLRNGVELLIRPEHVVLANNGARMEGNSMINCPTGFLIGPHDPPRSAVVALPHVSRYIHDKRPAAQWIKESFEVAEG